MHAQAIGRCTLRHWLRLLVTTVTAVVWLSAAPVHAADVGQLPG